MLKPTNLLEKIYLLLTTISFITVISIVHLIQNGINIGNNLIIQEEYIESFSIIVLLFIAYILSRLYKKETRKNRNKMDEAFKYIGRANVQLQEIEKSFTGFEKFPENKKELRNIIIFFAERTLSIINTNWVLIRIIDVNNLQTLQRHTQVRKGVTLPKYEIPNNKVIMEAKTTNRYKIITSKQTNLGLKVYFIFPIKRISEKESMLIKTIINELEMVFVIFNLKFYKKR